MNGLARSGLWVTLVAHRSEAKAPLQAVYEENHLQVYTDVSWLATFAEECKCALPGNSAQRQYQMHLDEESIVHLAVVLASEVRLNRPLKSPPSSYITCLAKIICICILRNEQDNVSSLDEPRKY